MYLQLTSNILLLNNRPEEAVSSIVVSNMFMSGFFVALLYSVLQNSLPPGAILPTLPFLLLDMSLAILIYMVSHLHTRTTAMRTRISFWTVVVFAARFVAFSVFSTWLWVTEINKPNPGQCIEPRVFLFSNIGAYSDWLHKGGTTLYAIVIFGSLSLVSSLSAEFRRLRRAQASMGR